MDLTLVLLIIAVIVILILLLLLLRQRAPEKPASPQDAAPTPDSSLRIKKIDHPFGFKGDPGNPLNQRIVEAVNLMGGIGVDAEANFQASVEGLRANAPDVIQIVAAEYRALPENNYLNRWSLIQLLAELKHPAALPVLDDVLSSTIPAEQSRGAHRFSTVGREIMIRTTAVEGAARIGAQGNPEALELLLKHARHENFSVRRACVQGYLAHGGQDARERLLRVLPESDRHILDIRREDVRNVPQLQGEKYLKRPETSDFPRTSASRSRPTRPVK